MPPVLAELDAAFTAGEIISVADDLYGAWEVVLSRVPVSARLPRYGERGADRAAWARWTGPLTPRGVMMAARHAEPEDADYLTQMVANGEYHERLQLWRSMRSPGSLGTTV